MGCEDYGDYSHLHKCIDADCLLNVTFKAEDFGSSVGLKIMISTNNNDSQHDVVYLSGLDLYGAEFINEDLERINSKNSNNSGKFIENECDIDWSMQKNIKVLRFAQSIAMTGEQIIYIEFIRKNIFIKS